MPFIHEDFLLSTKTARRLFHTYAEAEPILDYHCHLPPADIASNRRFNNLFEIWLEGDHYKWRAMRANGVDEQLITGNADPFDKFVAWANVSPLTLRNPLYHWTQLELKRYFGIDELLDGSSARRIWDEANAQLATEELRTHGILNKFSVRGLCTTDDPADELDVHKQIQALGLSTKVLPTFRPDKALRVDRPEIFNPWADRIGAHRSFQSFQDAVVKRHNEFHAIGCRLSDHGLNHCYSTYGSDETLAAIYSKVRAGNAATPEEHEIFASHMMLLFGQLNAKNGWTQQLHLGAYRAANTSALAKIGPDTGFDSIGDWQQVPKLGAYLDRLNAENALPKMILYNVNPVDNYAFASMAGNFQIQFGSAWWFVDQKEGMEWQINALSNVGLLSKFIGMLTDSRSFMSYPRHEYFRRTLCNLIGKDIENGEIPDSDELVGPMIRNICYKNVVDYLNLG
jgi:glucuronate isomerase